jgi:hypothetical protein
MVLVIFAIAILALLAITMLDEATTDLVIVRNHASGLKALYAAHGGIGGAVAALRANPATAGALSGTLTAPDGSTCTYAAVISSASPIVTVTATGTADGFTRKVRARMLVTGSPLASPYPVRIVSWQEVVGSS